MSQSSVELAAASVEGVQFSHWRVKGEIMKLTVYLLWSSYLVNTWPKSDGGPCQTCWWSVARVLSEKAVEKSIFYNIHFYCSVPLRFNLVSDRTKWSQFPSDAHVCHWHAHYYFGLHVILEVNLYYTWAHPSLQHLSWCLSLSLLAGYEKSASWSWLNARRQITLVQS